MGKTSVRLRVAYSEHDSKSQVLVQNAHRYLGALSQSLLVPYKLRLRLLFIQIHEPHRVLFK